MSKAMISGVIANSAIVLTVLAIPLKQEQNIQ